MHGTILVVDDNEDTAELTCELLRKRGFEAHAVSSGAAAIEYLRTHVADVVVTDVEMPAMSGIELCAILRERHPDLLPIVITGHHDVDTAIAAIRAGAYDFISKPADLDALEIALSRAVEFLELKREVRRLRTVQRDRTIDGLSGASAAVREMIEVIHRVADSDASVLITGESGTGKELVARALHARSPRRDHPFVAVNCAAMPATLLESELFGHVRGAFTDAKQDRQGLFVRAAGGTILLDEIGDMPTEMQVKLLRVLQQHTVRPVGGDVEVAFEARVLTSTNRDLEADVAARRFREDLFYRINVVQIVVPPLRDRAADILTLAQQFVDAIAIRSKNPVRGFSAPAARMLVQYDWPGNVRELENCVERAVAVCRLDEITPDDLPIKIQMHASGKLMLPAALPSDLVTMDEMERRYVRQVLGAVGGNKSRAARILGMDRRSLYRRLEDAQSATPAPLSADGPTIAWHGHDSKRA